MKLFTIGFTRKSAEAFFTTLTTAGVKHLIDVRLNNVSQLAGFSKRDDLAYFARAICRIPYTHAMDLAPTADMLAAVKRGQDGWDAYERRFLDLMRERRIETLPRAGFENACLLCSEPAPHKCHRRLVADYLGRYWTDLSVTHL